jgi:hypothetical protein
MLTRWGNSDALPLLGGFPNLNLRRAAIVAILSCSVAWGHGLYVLTLHDILTAISLIF